MKRLYNGLLGALLGSITAVAVQWWFAEVNWIFVAICAGVCFVVAFIWGEPFLDWLKDVLENV